MQTLTLSTHGLLAPPEAPQAANGLLDPEKVKKEGAFKLDFLYVGKASNQKIDIRIEIWIDQFSPSVVWGAYFTTLTTGKEQVLAASSLFNHRFRNGSALISYTATINGIAEPSSTLQLSIVDTP